MTDGPRHHLDTLPKPLRILGWYLAAIGTAGIAAYFMLRIVAPTLAKPETGEVYLVPGRRNTDFYVTAYYAYVLRIGLAHLVALCVLVSVVWLYRETAPRPKHSSDCHPGFGAAKDRDP